MFGLMRARTCVKHTEAWRDWRGHYCGTCKTIGARYGQTARMALNHDTVFLAELLTALSGELEQSAAYRSFNCMSMPKRDAEMPLVLRYAAAATLVLAEFKVIDHIEDTGRRRWRALGRIFSKPFQQAQRDLREFGFPLERLRGVLATQSARERDGKTLGEFSAPTAEATALFFAHGGPLLGLASSCGETLEALGSKFGELAYLLDAYEDFEKDQASGAFNAIAALNGSKADLLPELRRLTAEIRGALGRLPLPPEVAASFGSRLQANLDAKLGLYVCKPRVASRASRQERWQSAVTFARKLSLDAPKWRASATVLAVAVIAYLAPSHSRAANTPAECLSLGFNLMALGSMFAMAAGGGGLPQPPIHPVDPGVRPPGAPAPGKVKSGSRGCGCCCDSDCCDGCNCCCCACEGIECCSGCGDCCSGCGECGSCCDC